MLDHILFLGTPDFSVPTLAGLVDHPSVKKLSVITMPDKPRGRGKTPVPTPVKALALTRNLTVYSPESASDLTDLVQSIDPSLLIIVAYGRIIQATITDNYLCINIHSSLLPKYRGASPIHSAILAGDTTTGVTLMKINERMDAGDIILQEHCPILPSDTLGSLTQSLANLGASTCMRWLTDYAATGTLELTPQIEVDATYTKKIEKDDLLLQAGEPALQLVKKIHAFSPKPGAYIMQGAKRLKLLSARLEDGKVVLEQVQPEGKPPMTYHDYCLGHPEGVKL